MSDATPPPDPDEPQFDADDGMVVRQVAVAVERNARLARWFGTGLVVIGVMAMMASAAATVYIGVQVRGLVQQFADEQTEEADLRAREEARREEATRLEALLVNDIMNCLLGQFAEHRAATSNYHSRAATAHGFPPPPKSGRNIVPADPEKTRMACERTIRKLDEGG